MIIAIILAYLWVSTDAKKRGLSNKFLFDNFVSTLLIGIIGARILFGLIYFRSFSSVLEIFYIWQGGLVSLGGFLFGGLTIIWLLRKQHEPINKWLDEISLAALLAVSVGRIGCYLSGDIPGRLTDRFSKGVPVTLLESLIVFGWFVLLIIIRKKFKELGDGAIFLWAVFLYSLSRLILDGYRESQELVLGLNFGQIIALLSIIVILVICASKLVRERSRYGAKTNPKN